MNFNTEEYKDSLLKNIDSGLISAMEKLAPFAKIKNEDKTPEELFEETALKERVGALKLMKAELIRESNINYKTSIEYKNTQDQEVSVLLKMVNNHEESIKGYKNAGNNVLAEKEENELKVIKEFTPKQPTEEDIVNFTKEVIAEYLATKEDGYTPSMRDMGQIVPKVKAKFPNVDGNIIRKTLLG